MAGEFMTRSQAVTFGRGATLVGVITKPSRDVAVEGLAVVVLNAGVIHHVGPNRLHVMLAETLAQAGFQSLRFDLSGIGDSGMRHDVHDLNGSAMRDIDDALTFLGERHGVTRFVMVGLCTGANNALRVAHRDPRVVGVVPIDPFSYKTFGYHLRHYGRRLFRSASWRNALSGRNRYLKGFWGRQEDAATVEAFTNIGGTVAPPPRVAQVEMADMLGGLVDRAIPTLHVFTGGNVRYNHRDQLWEVFRFLPRRGSVDVKFMPEAGHTFERRAHREEVARFLCDWMSNTTFPTP